MGVIMAIGDPADGSLKAQAFLNEGGPGANPTFEDKTRRGEQAELDPGNDPESGQRMPVGGQKWNNTGQTSRFETFLLFTPARGLALPPNSGDMELVNSSMRVSRNGLQHDGGSTGFAADDALQMYPRDWNPPLSPSAWVDLMPLIGNAVPELEFGAWLRDRTPSFNIYEASGYLNFDAIRAKLAAGGSASYLAILNSEILGYPRDGNWLAWLVSTSHTQVAPRYYPTMVLRTIRKHALNHVLGASIQLTDGTAVFLRWDATNERISLHFQKVGATVPTQIDVVDSKTATQDNSGGATQWFGIEPGAQTFGLTRDDANNLYIAGARGNLQPTQFGQKVFNVAGFKYTGSGGNHSWIAYTQGTSGENGEEAAATHRGMPNNFAPVWLPNSQGGPLGALAVFHSRRDGHWSRFQMGIATDYAGFWLGNAPNGKRHNIAYCDQPEVATYWRPWNSSGTGLDAFRDGDRVRFASFIQPARNEDAERSALGKSLILPDGSLGNLGFAPNSISTNSPHDPDAKIRALWLGDQSTYYGIARHGHIAIHNKADDTIFKQIDLTASGIAGMPARTALQKSSAWDVLWDSGDPEWIWIYFKDANNGRIIRKVRWNFVKGSLDTSFEFTGEPLGASGSEIIAIRVPRQQIDTRCVLLDVAMQDGSGAGTGLITIRDVSMNVPPGAPVIDPIASFNAAGTKAIEWTFSDKNSQDFATFQDIQIRNVATGATVHSVNHITAAVVNAGTRKYRYTIGANVLSNDANYQIRIRSYDSVDLGGAWTGWSAFSTSGTGGLVRITDPAADLLPLNRSSVLVKWTYSNTVQTVVQTGYRVRVYNDVTNVIVSDTGIIASTAKQHQVVGLASDTTYRIEVNVRDSNTQTSGAGVRLVYPDFNNPSLPTIIAISGKGFIEIRVSNPPPSGENPVTLVNQIARREVDQSEEQYVLIGECPPNGVFKDWTVASGVTYIYKARGSS